MGERPKVIIVGAGFAGLNAAKSLKRAPADVLLIDANNYHTFRPLLYQVATAALDIGDIAHQVRDVFRHHDNLRFRQGTVVGVDWDRKQVVLEDGDQLPFDYLILAAGAVYTDFGTPGVMEHAFLLESVTAASELRSHILRQFELAAQDPKHIEQGALTFVLVGAGPTGVEMAGALLELLERVLPADYPELDVTRAKVVMLEMGDAVLPPFGKRSQRYAEKVLRSRGADIRLGEKVTAVHADHVDLGSGGSIPTRTLIWAAGVRANPLVEALGLPLERGFRVKASPDLSLEDHPKVFATGDLSNVLGPDGKPYAQVAQVAIQQGKHAARMVLADLRGRAREPFHYFDKGIMAIIGRNAGVAELTPRLGGFRLRGFLGWLGWLFIHLIYLPGFKNRFSTFSSWAYEYLTYDRHARLILEREPDHPEDEDRARPPAPHDASTIPTASPPPHEAAVTTAAIVGPWQTRN